MTIAAVPPAPCSRHFPPEDRSYRAQNVAAHAAAAEAAGARRSTDPDAHFDAVMALTDLAA